MPLAFVLSLLLLLTQPARAETDVVTLFAAASLSNAVEEIAALHRQGNGARLRLSFAASSTLARQIEAGAPADIFLSANRRWMDHLDAASLLEPGTRREVIGNELVLIAPLESPLTPVSPSAESRIVELLGPDERLAIGDPAHVPAGLYGRAALERLGQWQELEPRLARADNVRAALALVARGEAPLGIVYASDARISDRIKVLGVFPPDSHPPIRYPFAILAGEGRAAVRALFARLTGSEAQAVFARHGFQVLE